MAVVKHSITKEELANVGKGGEPPKPGVYQAKIIQAEHKTPKDKSGRIEVIYEISKGDSKGFRLYDYLVDGEASKWKRDQFWVAAGLVTVKGSTVKVDPLDSDKVHRLPEVLVRVDNRTWNEQVQADIKGVYPLDSDTEDEDAETDEDEDTSSPLGDDEDETTEDGEVDLDSMDKDELIEFAEENEIEIPATAKTAAKIRAFIAAQFDDGDEDEAEAEPEDEDADVEVDVEALSLKEARALADEHGIEHKGVKRADLNEALLEALGGEAEPDEDEAEAEDEEPIDYSEWTLADLKEELTDRGIKAVGPRSKLVKLLEDSDSTGGV